MALYILTPSAGVTLPTVCLCRVTKLSLFVKRDEQHSCGGRWRKRTSRTRHAVSLRPAQAYQLSLLSRGTSNIVAEGDGESEPCGHGMPCPYDQRKHINCPSLSRGMSNIVAEGDGNHANLADTACRVPTAWFVIFSIAKNLSIHGMRYFTTLRSVQYDSLRVVCHFR